MRPRYFRKVIRITAEDSPNVQRYLAQKAAGVQPDFLRVLPGQLSAEQYLERRATWDLVRQCIGLDARFWKGAEFLLYPPDWLNAAERLADKLSGKRRHAKAIGIDPAEGGDKTAMCAVDEYGILELVSRRTPNTAAITDEAIAFGRKWDVPPEYWTFDRGGGGKQHADRLNAMGYPVRSIGFGQAPTLQASRVGHDFEDRKDARETAYVYVNMRAELYGELSLAMDPSLVNDSPRFSVPRGVTGDHSDRRSELRHQLAPVPRLYDKEGRIRMLPKSNPTNPNDPRTLVKLIGHSPDEADAVVLANWSMRNEPVSDGAMGAAWDVDAVEVG